jgi:hypothetical protein
VSTRSPRHLQRLVLTSFVVVFCLTRTLVFLIMSRDLPDLFLYVGGTHVHHLNYGIVLLSLVGALFLFHPPRGRWLDAAALAYGSGLALTFDEFGMWLHLGGSYWQRASLDAVVAVAGLLLLAAYMPPLKAWTTGRLLGALAVLGLVAVFFWRLSIAFAPIGHGAGVRLHDIEQSGPR